MNVFAQHDNLQISKTEQTWLNQHNNIRFTGDPNWLPYESFDEDGNYIGIIADHLVLIEQKLGINFEIIPTTTWSESVNKVKNKEIDILSESTNSDLNKELVFTQSYLSSPIVIIMNSDAKFVDNIVEIKGKQIAIIENYGYVPEIMANYPNIPFKTAHSLDEGLTRVSTGEIDALLATLAHASYHISEHGLNNLRIVGKTEFDTKMAFGVQKELAPLVPLLNRALASITPNEKQTILKKWGREKYIERTNYKQFASIIALLLLFISIFAYWNRKLTREIELRKDAETQIQTIIDSIPLQIIVTTINGEILSANPNAIADYEIDKTRIGDYNVLNFYANKNDRTEIVNELLAAGKVKQRIIQFIQPHDNIVSMMLSIIPINYQNQQALLAVAVDMTERIEFEAELQIAKDAAVSANQAKSIFLSNMSHEIRTPMNAILGFTALLNDQVKNPKHKGFVNTIQSAGDNLLTLINDILDLSKIEAGKITLKESNCDLQVLLIKLVEVFSIKINEKNLNLHLDIDPSLPQVIQLDETRLRQILLNLIGNAIKFTEHGSITIKVYISNNSTKTLDLSFEIIDTGIGISNDQQKLVFKAFEQSKGQNSTKYGGTGLGLSISRKLVKIMGGKISLKSEIGKGSTFKIQLFNIKISDDIIVDRQQSNDTTPIEFLGSKVLIVDDNIDNRNLVLAYLGNERLELVEAENGKQAIELASQHSFDIILMDIRMPIMDGYQAAKEIKKFTDMPIIALTASVMTSDFERLKANNFQGYVRKPFSKNELLSKLIKFLPYTQSNSLKQKKSSQPLLSTSEIKQLPELLLNLKKMIPLCQKAITNNNVSEIKKIAKSISELEQKFPTSLVKTFSTDLNSNITSFNIKAIKNSLVNFPKLIESLEEFT